MKPTRYRKAHPLILKYRQGIIETRCKGCAHNYLGYCLNNPFDKPPVCIHEKEKLSA